MATRQLLRGLAGAALLLGLGLGPRATAPIPTTPPSPSPVQISVCGTPSCSARACHGGLEPAPRRDGQRVEQVEYTRWLLQDKHAQAYQALLDDRSKSMARKLGLGEAHKSPRCLACHTNPALATVTYLSLAQEDTDTGRLLLAERQSGVGCEVCHGPANEWLNLHTAPARWWGLSPAAKAEKKMYPTGDLRKLAEACAGCHVGAPPDPMSGVPIRDVNHDLIAAGHPRLNFDFAAYLANMPRHWSKETDAAWGPERDAKAWAFGQLTGAAAALRLLEYRARPGEDAGDRPWPEFAEYDCFACHHALSEPSWRQTRGYAGRAPGSLPWGSWYLAMMPLLTRHAPDTEREKEDAPLSQLRRLMARPLPDRDLVANQAAQAVAQVEELLKKYEKAKLDLRVLAGSDRAITGWDAAAQTYLALSALYLARGMPDPELQGLLDAMIAQLRFDAPPSAAPSGPAGLANGGALSYDSPRRFEPRQFGELVEKFRGRVASVERRSEGLVFPV